MDWTFRQIAPHEYDVISEWFTKNDFIEPPKDMRGSIGVMAELNGKPIACGWLVPTATSICLYEWMQTNPSVSVYLKTKAVIALTGFMIQSAQEMGFKHLIGFTPETNKALLKLYKKLGATVGTKSLRTIHKEL